MIAKRFRGAVLAALLMPVQAVGQETPYPDYFKRGKPTAVHGQGSVSCGTFISNKQPFNIDSGAHAQEMAWVLGFLYAIDSWNPFDVKSYDYSGLDLWLENYCKTHTIDKLVNAANQFYSFIGGRVPMSSDYNIWKHYQNYEKQ